MDDKYKFHFGEHGLVDELEKGAKKPHIEKQEEATK
jgi:hypothetical protein